MQDRRLQGLPESVQGGAAAGNCGTNETRSDAMNISEACTAKQTDRGHRVLYVLVSSLGLVVIGMIAVALTA
jgi:hypothetical protein